MTFWLRWSIKTARSLKNNTDLLKVYISRADFDVSFIYSNSTGESNP
jgi:hypothetical protein